MSISLKDQLLALGFKKADPPPKLNKPPQPQQHKHAGKHGGKPADGQRRDTRPAPHAAKPHHDRKPQHGKKPRSQEEIDLAKAYAIRAQAEKAERARVEREAQERAREKKERKQKLATLLADKSLNVGDADVPRHFPHGDKIRRIYVTAEQLAKLNAGELGVVQHLGRYLLVEAAVAKSAQEISPESLVLLPDPNAQPEDDIPPDLVW